MNSRRQSLTSGQKPSGLTLAALFSLFLILAASVAQAEKPHFALRPFAPGGIAIDWEHPNDGANGIVLQRENPAFTWNFTALVNSFNDLGLSAATEYRYRVCAVYAQALDCTDWHAARTFSAVPPVSPRGVPSFTSASSTGDSVTVNWTSSADFSFHQVRWAENGRGDRQQRVSGRSFTVGGLRPGTYHFIVQGCSRGLVGSNCSRFSQPIEVAVRPPPPPPEIAHSIISAVTGNGDLLWFRHQGRSGGSFTWAPGTGNRISNGWSGFSSVFSGGNGVIYAVEERSMNVRTLQTTGGRLLWFRHVGWRDGSPAWTASRIVGTYWNTLSKVFSGGDGVIYGIAENGDLRWYRHDGRDDGSFRWAAGAGTPVGNGWGGFSTVFSGGNGVIYAIEEQSIDVRIGHGQRTGGRLLWYRHDGWRDGSRTWVGPEVVGDLRDGWSAFSKVFSGGDGVIYAIADNGDLLWYYHAGWRSGSRSWAPGSGQKVGTSWNGLLAVTATPSCGFGLEGDPC